MDLHLHKYPGLMQHFATAYGQSISEQRELPSFEKYIVKHRFRSLKKMGVKYASS